MQINIIKEKSIDKKVNIQCTGLEMRIVCRLFLLLCRLKACERYETILRASRIGQNKTFFDWNWSYLGAATSGQKLWGVAGIEQTF